MKIVERADLNTELWDKLVYDSVDSTIFSLSFYLDAVAENWCVLVDETYSKGIALPYTIRLNVKTLYTPIYLMYVEWLGEDLPKDLIVLLQETFAVGDICMKDKLADPNRKEYVRQELIKFKYNEQTKRALKRFEKSGLQLVNSKLENDILTIIESELPAKIASLDKQAILTLNKLVPKIAQNEMLSSFAILADDKVVGGILSMQFKNRIIYLKGAFKDSAKKNGAMFKCITTLIGEESETQNIIDFGGSRVENVRKFNMNFGSVDCIYYNYTWNKAPFHFKVLKRLKNVIK
jgi:hypothetical protein